MTASRAGPGARYTSSSLASPASVAPPPSPCPERQSASAQMSVLQLHAQFVLGQVYDVTRRRREPRSSCPDTSQFIWPFSATRRSPVICSIAIPSSNPDTNPTLSLSGPLDSARPSSVALAEQPEFRCNDCIQGGNAATQSRFSRPNQPQRLWRAPGCDGAGRADRNRRS